MGKHLQLYRGRDNKIVQSLEYTTLILTVEADMNMVPMIVGDRPSILHWSPLRPWHDRVSRRVPDLLSPDDIFESQRSTVVHDPFSDRFPNLGRHLQAVLANRGTMNRGETPTPPADEHMKSIAIPQQ
jgi:hypothetical protein